MPRYYVDLRCLREAGTAGDAMESRLDASFDAWLNASGRNHVSLLGDFGAGKSWFCRRFAYRQACRYLAAPSSERVPLLISLREYAKAYDIEQAITHALVNQYGIALNAGYQTFRCLNERGKLLLIFDGFNDVADFEPLATTPRNSLRPL